MTKLVLKRYFKEHPERYGRMVAAYAIGQTCRGLSGRTPVNAGRTAYSGQFA